MQLPQKERIEFWQSMSGLAFKIAVAAGGLLMLIYCMSEGVLPEDVSVGDSVFLVWCLISFGFISIVGTLYGAIASLWIVCLILKLGNSYQQLKGRPQAVFVEILRSAALIYAASPMCFAAFLLVALTTDARPDMRLAETIGFFVLFGGFLVMAFGVIPASGKRISWQLSFLIVGGVAVMITAGTRPALLNVTMSMLGVRSLPGEAVVVSDAERVRIAGYAKLYGIDVAFCELPGQGQSAIANAYVVWHAVGATSFVHLPVGPKSIERGIVVPTPRKELAVIGRDRLAPGCPKHGKDYDTASGT
jgi:hypothetical protein